MGALAFSVRAAVAPSRAPALARPRHPLIALAIIEKDGSRFGLAALALI
jgi:hypothetical protein